MGTIEIDIVRFNRGPMTGQWGVLIDYFPEFSLMDYQGRVLVGWNSFEEEAAEEGVGKSGSEPSPYAGFRGENAWEIVHLEFLRIDMLKMLVVVAGKLKSDGIETQLVFCQTNIQPTGPELDETVTGV